ncbi:formyltransferase family protein [Brevibacillus sp. AY1]|uniref:methionyl-tRNA formyltransferase n=1 Tax=Brevibacillus sp. AY1 TaxID=2807621 RepID=UPI0024563A14|nr:formyltransferase family protein [Brevibacillus sp. AY1]MDH4618260.1 formyl transferase [Brevibacillus sp. AY1]
MKIVFIGCVKFSEMALKQVLQCSEAEVIGVITKKFSSYNADFSSLEGIAKEKNIPCLLIDKQPEVQMEDWIKDKNPDVVYCFGWSNLLPQEVLNIPRLGVIGYHPTPLPKNRGRHPIIWTIALGLTSTASTFFFMDEGADSGDIISQEFLSVEDSDDAGKLYSKLSNIAAIQILQFTRELSQSSYKRLPQDDSKANYWRKRTKQDGEIDWRMSARSIHNLVKALARPYVGAHCLYQGQEIKIWKTEIVLEQDDFSHLEPGKVLKVETSSLYVKCGEGIIRILDHEFTNLPEEGCYF